MTKKITLILLTVLMQSFLWAQDATLKGKVTEPNGEGIIQASVMVDVSKGWAVATDIDGNYSLKLPAGEHTVTYRSLGMKDKTINIVLKAGETKVQNITMQEEAKMINTIVVTASKYGKKMSEETVSIEVLDNDILENNNIVDAEEGVNKVPGVTVTEGQANIRGGSGWSYGVGSRVMVLYDDLPLISAEGGDTKWSFIPIENVEQIEVIKGAASSIYGSGALNGVINIRTGYAKSKPETSISTFSGIMFAPPGHQGAWWLQDGNQTPFNAGATILHKQKIKQVDLVMHGQYNLKKNHLKSNDYSSARVGAKFRYRFKKIPGLNMGINTNFYRSWGRNFFLWNGYGNQARQPIPGTSTKYQSLRWTIDPFINYRDKKGNHFSYKFRYFNTANETEQGQGSVPVNYYNEFQYNRYFEKIKFNIVAGMVGNFSTIRSATGNAEETLTGEFNSFNLAPYLQLEKKLFNNKLNLTFGTRFEYFSLRSVAPDSTGKYLEKTSLQKDNLLNRPLFRGGINYRVAKATFLRASFGEGYRFPSIAESFVSLNLGGIQVVPNPKLKAEKGWYGEIGVKQGFELKKWQGFADLAFFITRYQDMIEANFGQYGNSSDNFFGLGFSFQNVGNTQILGGDFSLGAKGMIGNFPLQLMFGYTYIHPTSLDWDEKLTLYNKDGEAITPGQIIYSDSVNIGGGTLPPPIDISAFMPASSKGRADTYAGTSTSDENILKYRSRHVLTLDAQTSYKQWDFGISLQFRSKFENIDYFFVSPFLTQSLYDYAQNESALEVATEAVIEQLQESGFLVNGATSIEEGIGTKAFSGVKEYEEIYKDRPGIALFDARVAYNFNERAKIALIGKNLFNMNYAIRPAIMGDPMTLQLKFSYKFTHDKKKK